jgi:hypothetical protein
MFHGVAGLRRSVLDQLKLVNQPPDLERVNEQGRQSCLGACLFGMSLPLGTISFALLVPVVSRLGDRAYFAAWPIVGASRGYSVEVRPITGDWLGVRASRMWVGEEPTIIGGRVAL